MHTAKELHDFMGIDTAGPIVIHRPSSDYTTILRALSLLASVEDEDGIVRELREGHGNQDCDHCERDPVHYVRCGRGDCVADEMLRQQASALIVSQRAELERVKGERDALRKHAEAIANDAGVLQEKVSFVNRYRDEERHPEVAEALKCVRTSISAYRAAHPKNG